MPAVIDLFQFKMNDIKEMIVVFRLKNFISVLPSFFSLESYPGKNVRRDPTNPTRDPTLIPSGIPGGIPTGIMERLGRDPTRDPTNPGWDPAQ